MLKCSVSKVRRERHQAVTGPSSERPIGRSTPVPPRPPLFIQIRDAFGVQGA
jgi:hypothetical protein